MKLNNVINTAYLNEGLGKFLDRITSGKVSKLHPDSIISKLPQDTLFLVFDTETTGLNMFGDDQVTEVAILAYDKKFNYVDRYHASNPAGPEKQPSVIVGKAAMKLNKIVPDLKMKEIQEFVLHVFKEYARYTKRGGQVGLEFMYPILQDMAEKHDIDPEGGQIKQMHRVMSDILSAHDIKKVMRMTKYGKVAVDTKEPNEQTMAKHFIEFVDQMSERSNNLVAVAHNYPYDYQMMRQAAGRAGLTYNLKKFIDTALLARKFAAKYIYATFMYYVEQWETEPSTRIEKLLKKLKPSANARMGTLAEYFAIPNLAWHTAKNDVEATAEILKYLLALDARFRDFFDGNQYIADRLSEMEAKYEKTKGGKDADFLQGMTQPYLKAHKKEYSKFLDEIGESEEEPEKGRSPYSIGKEYEKKYAEEFPGTKVGVKKRKASKEGKKFKSFRKESAI